MEQGEKQPDNLFHILSPFRYSNCHMPTSLSNKVTVKSNSVGTNCLAIATGLATQRLSDFRPLWEITLKGHDQSIVVVESLGTFTLNITTLS